LVTLETTRFGVIDIDPDAVVSFPDGLPGFPDVRGVTLIKVSDDQPFYWLQDVDRGDLAFLAVVPWEYFPEYELALSDEDESALEVEDPADLLVLALVTVDREVSLVTANLLGPIVVNQSKRLARQTVLLGDHSTRTPLGV
jgi:flagellar assembly factor FliW